MQDIAEKAEKILGHEAEFKSKYLELQASLADKNQAEVRKELKRAEKRTKELDKLVETAFEEKVSGKIPESVCIRLIEKYTSEQTELKEKIAALTQGLEEVQQDHLPIIPIPMPQQILVRILVIIQIVRQILMAVVAHL